MKVKFQQATVLIVMVLAGCLPQTGEERVLVGNVQEYRLGAGDQVRVLVFEQATLSNVYTVDASGKISVPLVGTVRASNRTTRQLEADIAGQLKERDLVSDPKVAVEVATYRPFSILGEVKTAGRYPFAPGMTIEAAVALAGGYTIHADRDQVRVTRRMGSDAVTESVPPSSTFAPGDTITVRERWY
jgi:polysaccharide biosynthesis/export protein